MDSLLVLAWVLEQAWVEPQGSHLEALGCTLFLVERGHIQLNLHTRCQERLECQLGLALEVAACQNLDERNCGRQRLVLAQALVCKTSQSWWQRG